MTTTGAPPTGIRRWRNRIVGHGEMRAGDFLANEKNWRIHPQFQQQAVAGILKEVGFVQDVIVNKRTDPSWGANREVETLVDGHLRVAEALREGEDVLVPMVYVDLLPDEEAKILALLDPLASLATTDSDKLKELLAEFQSQDETLAKLSKDLQADVARAERNMREGSTANELVRSQYMIIVECADETAQAMMLERFAAEGVKCKALIS